MTLHIYIKLIPKDCQVPFVLYVKSKETGKFAVGFTNPIDVDVKFNWWVIEIK